MQKQDSGIECLVSIAKLLGIPADSEQMRRAYIFDDKGMDTITFLRAAKQLKLKARRMTPNPDTIDRLPKPAVAILQQNRYVVILRTDATNMLILDPLHQSQPFVITREQFDALWTGEMILVTKRFAIGEKLKKFDISWFFPVVLRYKRFFLEVLFVSLLLQLLGLASPLFTQVIIDKVLVHRSVDTLDVLIGGMVIVSLFQVWITGLRQYLFIHTTNKVDVELSSLLFKHITALPIRYFETWQVGDVVSRVGELGTIRQFITGSFFTLVLDILFAIVYLAVMFVYSGMLSIIVIVAVICFLILNFAASPLYRRLINDQFLVGAENQSFMIEAITGIKTVKTMAVESEFIQKYENILARYVKAAFNTLNLANIAGSIGMFLQQAFNITVLWVGAHTVMKGNMSVGELIAFQMLAGQVLAPVLRLVSMWQYFQKTRVSVDRLGDIMNYTSEPAFNPNRTTLPAITGEIVFDRVSFRYRADGSEVLRQISLRIQPGMRVGIVGRSGSGKSTLTKLIQRLYVPESGRVLIDGVDLAQVEPAWLRRQIGVVLQENYLFSGTIRDNIATAKPNATDDEIQQVAILSGAIEFIQQMPRQYDSFVGERGSLLSGGQRQRISIARALLLDPKIIIFDEATSALDYESEKIILDHLDHMAAGRTMIMIAHRLSTVRNCDTIIVMDQGRIVEQGTHTNLMQQRGIYYHLYNQQEDEQVGNRSEIVC